MYFKFSGRTNPKTNQYSSYYRLVESYRTETGRVNHRTILNIGFIEDELNPTQLNLIAKRLTHIYEKKPLLFTEEDEVVSKWVTNLWGQIVSERRLDITLFDEKSRMVKIDTIKHSQVREIGTEWMCYNTWHKLGLDEVLRKSDFTESEILLAQTQIISRAVYPGSELATSNWIRENSGISELTLFPLEKINKDCLYKSALKLYDVKVELEQHLSVKTNELFDIQDKILLYDLTNTYFEGEKRNSKLAKYGRSKEKRKDCKLIVLALVVNVHGFIKHSSLHEGNFSDAKGISEIIDSLEYVKGSYSPTVVLDAGIATEENLAIIVKKGYNYVCVSRSKLKDYEFDLNSPSISFQTKSKKEIEIRKVITSKKSDYYLEIKSPMKAMKESGMKSQFEKRYEEELTKIKTSLSKKGGVKTVEKVNQRIGRAKQKYPSVQGRYTIKSIHDAQNINVIDLEWEINPIKNATDIEELGKYFIRTNLDMNEETWVWEVYNTIREIESTFRTLKTDLDLRPIYHKNDNSTLAHLHLGLLAYWLVNTIRCQLKKYKINNCWTEIVRTGNTQKIISTSGYNKAGVEISVRKCSEPEKKLSDLYRALDIKPRPYTIRKSVVHKTEIRKTQKNDYQDFTST